MTTDKIMTLHPDPARQGVNIDRAKYEQMKAAILAAIDANGGIAFTALREKLDAEMTHRFEGSVGWYLTTVKLDLQARGTITASGSPQMLRRA